MGLTTWDRQHGTGNMGPETWDWQHGTGNMGLATWDWQPPGQAIFETIFS